MNDVVRNFRVKKFKMNYPAVIWSKINWINGCCKTLLPKAEGPIWDKAYFDPKKYISKPKSTFSNFYDYQLFTAETTMHMHWNSDFVLEKLQKFSILPWRPNLPKTEKGNQNHLSVYITWDIYLCPFPQFASTKASPETLADS